MVRALWQLWLAAKIACKCSVGGVAKFFSYCHHMSLAVTLAFAIIIRLKTLLFSDPVTRSRQNTFISKPLSVSIQRDLQFKMVVVYHHKRESRALIFRCYDVSSSMQICGSSIAPTNSRINTRWRCVLVGRKINQLNLTDWWGHVTISLLEQRHPYNKY